MWWGGLRGSVGLALALVIQHTIYDQKMWGESDDDGSHMIRNWEGDKVNSLNCRLTLTLAPSPDPTPNPAPSPTPNHRSTRSTAATNRSSSSR